MYAKIQHGEAICWKNVILRNRNVKLVKWKNRGKIGFAFSTLAEWWKWKILHWLTMWHCVWKQLGMMWQCEGVLCTKNYLLPSGKEEYYTTLCSRMLFWFIYFMASRICQRLVFLPSIEYKINIETECYHSYNCYVLITKMVSLLSPYRRTHCFPDHILLAVSAL